MINDNISDFSNIFEKAKKDTSKLQKKVVTNKRGKKTTVYVAPEKTNSKQLREEAVKHAAQLGLFNMVKELENPKKVSDKQIKEAIGQLRDDVKLQKKQRRYKYT